MDTRSYLLGLFDGEGSLRITHDAVGKWGLEAVVGSRSAETASAFQDEWAGNRYTYPQGNGTIIEWWKIAGASALPILTFLTRHALVKGRQAKVCRAMAENYVRFQAPVRRGLIRGTSILPEIAEKERIALFGRMKELRHGSDRYGPSDEWSADGIDWQSYSIGLFDAEGSVGTARSSGGSWRVLLSISLCGEEAVRKIAQTWGIGGISRRTLPTVGGHTLWAWQAAGANALPFLSYAAEHAIEKREQARLGLLLAQNVAKYERKGMAGQKFGGVLIPRFVTDEDRSAREQIVTAIRAANGARSRYGKGHPT